MSEPSLDHVDLMFPNRYLKAADLRGKDWTGTIAKVEFEDLQMVGGAKVRKPIVHFQEMAKRAEDDRKVLVLGKTTARQVASLHGNKPREWAGRQITVFPTRVRFGKNMVDAIRILTPDEERRRSREGQGR